MDQAAQELEKDAADQQQQAAEAASKDQMSSARSHGESASKSLASAQSRLMQMQKEHSESRQAVDLAAVRRGAQDLLSLQRGSEDNAKSEQDTRERSDRATDLSDGVSRVADSLSALSRRTPFISPQLQEALGQAIDRLSRSGRELANGDRQQGEANGREGSRALSEAVLELRRSRDRRCARAVPSPAVSRRAQQMGELGERQSRGQSPDARTSRAD